VALTLWMIVRRLGADPGVWTVALSVVHVVLYGALVLAFRVIRPADIRPMIGNLLKAKA
jgi:hypothetical protein